MTLDTIIMVVGAFVAALPLSGLPRDWQDAFSFLAGIIVIALGIVVRRHMARRRPGEEQSAPHRAAAHYEDSR